MVKGQSYVSLTKYSSVMGLPRSVVAGAALPIRILRL